MIRQFVLDSKVVTPMHRVAAAAAGLIAHRLSELWGSSDYIDATAHGASSQKIQHLIGANLATLGFQPEVTSRVGLAEFRADFALVDGQDGVLVEIERGKTTDNNMDMLDLWKAHVHGTAHHLILVVPVWYRTTKQVKRSFANVCRRMSPFFEAGFETNVHSLHVVGY